MKNIFIIVLLIFAFMQLSAQQKNNKSRKELKAEKNAKRIEEIKAIVDSKTFVFNATNANPMSGSTINLISQYEVKITSDSIFSYLPYFGVAYNVNYGSTDSPMIFNKPFETCDMETTKNGYRVKISVKNGNDILEYNFFISETGTTTLNLSSLNRQSISYYGNLEKIEEKEETK